MTFATLKEVLDTAKAGKYGVGAFNINNMEIAKAIGNAAKEEKSPVILAVSPSAIKYAGIEYIYEIARVTAVKSKVPTVLHLDHGTEFKDCVQCIRHGWSSVMYDGSKLPFQENIAMTKKIVEFAHAAGVSVEAELGKLAGVEGHVSVSEKDAIFTNPEEAKIFVEQTGVDALAVAIGTSHGAFKFKGEANLDFERLQKIEKLVGIPIVLHGASGVPKEVLEKAAKYGAKLPGAAGVPNDAIQKAISLGVAKINIDTDIRLTMTAAIRQVLTEHPEEFDPRKIFGPAEEAMKEVAKGKMRLFGSSGKA
ncbi:class II fructose-bisphosphate aldolase [Methanocella arvoryzae]|uniref:Fructose-bisphosphate aldolase (Class II) n=1 Tax=Methanocella arvoryzae (strain DSM 22066 / NBRC 105507 / MRE50) TaxID=351160 RepID=Q0W4P9_METAR|nr:ketose-bisphosphate aldolase [Methanocella arvoryzae]CAJ36644.1 fructose-bisphosphate aldolase (class II) [Methanocella arvoryzae MRE50]